MHDAVGDIVSLRDVIESDKATLWEMPLPNALASCLSCSKYYAQPSRSPFRFIQTNAILKSVLPKENAAGIPMDAAERNYKDPNHKPELVFALTSSSR